MKNLYFIIFTSLLIFGCESNSSENNLSGTGGSMARFTISGNYLYTVDHHNLSLYDISNPGDPVFQGKLSLGAGIETIFPYRNHLFIGSTNGMLIYDISNPKAPAHISTYNHVTSCDPVVVSGNYAYVTLRNGTNCRFGNNLLDVIDIGNFEQPRNVKSIDMINPHGLGVIDTALFVCEGSYGLKVFSIKQPDNPILIAEITDFHAYDVIPQKDKLIITGNDGIRQYSYSGISGPILLSTIAVEK